MSTTRRDFLVTTAALAGAAALARVGRGGGGGGTGVWEHSEVEKAGEDGEGGRLDSQAGEGGEEDIGLAVAEPALWDIPELKTPESTREGDMLYRKLGKTGEKVSLLGLGGYHFGSIATEAESTKLLRRAVDAGVTFMDNCWDYHNGGAE